jgi:hypothetical protein
MISKALPTFQLDPAILYSHQYSTTMKIIRKTLQTNHENHVWFLRKQQAGIVVAMIAFVVARAAEEPAPSMANLTLENEPVLVPGVAGHHRQRRALIHPRGPPGHGDGAGLATLAFHIKLGGV